MLITPSVKAMVDIGLLFPTSDKIQTPIQPIPEASGDIDIKLAEGQSVVYFKVHDKLQLEVLKTFRLEKFNVQNGTATWSFISDVNEIIPGSFQATQLDKHLSVKLLAPVVLLPSKHGLRVGFRFRTDADCRVLSASKFKDLIGEER